MDNKRKHESTDEIIRKIRIINKIIDSSDDEGEFDMHSFTDSEAENDTIKEESSDGPPQPSQPLPDSGPTVSTRPTCPEQVSLQGENSPPVNLKQEIKTEMITEEAGDAPEPEIRYGPPINQALADMQSRILERGLPKRQKAQLMRHLTTITGPISSSFMARELSPEIKAALGTEMVEQDLQFLNYINQLGLGVSAIYVGLSELIKKYEMDPSIAECFNGGFSLLCDCLFTVNEVRKKAIMTCLNPELRELLLKADSGNHLFGDNLSEELKIALKNAAKNQPKRAARGRPASCPRSAAGRTRRL